MCFWPALYMNVRRVRGLDSYVSMDSLTSTLASFSQRYLCWSTIWHYHTAWTDENYNLIRVREPENERWIKKWIPNPIAYPLRIPGISVTSTPGTSFYHLYSINTISFVSSNVSQWRWNLKMSAFRSPSNWYSTAIGSSAFEGLTDRSIVVCVFTERMQ